LFTAALYLAARWQCTTVQMSIRQIIPTRLCSDAVLAFLFQKSNRLFNVRRFALSRNLLNNIDRIMLSRKYPSLSLWNQLSSSFRQPHSANSLSLSDLPDQLLPHLLTLSTNHSHHQQLPLSYFRLKTYLFCENLSHHRLSLASGLTPRTI